MNCVFKIVQRITPGLIIEMFRGRHCELSIADMRAYPEASASEQDTDRPRRFLSGRTASDQRVVVRPDGMISLHSSVIFRPKN